MTAFGDKVKYAFQRARKGYCDKDLWEIDTWFSTVFAAMMKEFSEKTQSYPDKENVVYYKGEPNAEIIKTFAEKYPGLVLKSEMEDDSEEKFRKWTELTARMGALFEKTKRDPYYKGPTDEQIKAKDEAFDLLKDHYFDLWW